MMPPPTRAVPAAPGQIQSDIVLLEESDLYRYNDGAHVLHDTGAGYHHQARNPSIGSGPPADPVKYARSTHSYRSNGPNGYTASAMGGNAAYGLHNTPFAPGSKRTASIDTIPAHYGAMRPGGPVNLFTRDHFGLLLNWSIIGFFNGAIPGLVLPLFVSYLGYTRTQRSAVFALFDIGWYFKFVFGFITDNYAINRQRRKPYIFIGWTIFIGFMLAMAFMNKVKPYGESNNPSNPDAQSQGNRYVLPIMISSFAHLLSTVACEGMMVEFAHREGEYDRGRTQLWCVIFRFIGEVSGGVFPALSLSSAEYGGTFSTAIPLDWFFGVLAILAFVGIVITHFFLKDEQVPSTRQNFSSSLRRVWRFIEQRQTTQVMVALFVISIALVLPIYESSDILYYWNGADTLTVSLVQIFQSLGTVIVAGAFYLWFLNTNWRVLMAVGIIVATIIQIPIELMNTWDIFRDMTFFLGKDTVAGIFEAVPWLVRIMVVVEASEPGLESTTYGFLTTVANLANAVVRSTTNVIAAGWSEESVDIKADTNAARWHVTYQIIVKYSLRFALFAIGCYVMPRQKRHLKEIKIRGAPNLVIPIVLFTIAAGLFVAAITSAMLAMFASTSCLKFAGGGGCDLPKGK